MLHLPSFTPLFWLSGSAKELSRWRVISGRTHMTTFGGSYVDRIIINGDYNQARNDYDIALIKLSSPVTVGGQSSISFTRIHTANNE